jgi:hypothetical protein
MNTTEIVVLALVAALLALAAAVPGVIYLRKKTTQKLRSKFGPEYGRVVEESGDERKAEAQLQTREKRVARYRIRPLSPEDRARFVAEWRKVQSRFVDNPKDATTHADDLLDQVMTARGYPDGDLDRRLGDLSVDHAQTVQDYRAANDTVLRHSRGEADTEDMRQAIIHYRTLFDELVGERETAPMKAAS